jgi:putative ABC transport system substrate-binding protein
VKDDKRCALRRFSDQRRQIDEEVPFHDPRRLGLRDRQIVAGGTPQAQAAKQATRTIPIVFAAAGDPVTSGLVTSLARPGGNVTGLSALTPELVGKCLEQLKQAAPGVSRIAVLWQPGGYPERTDKDMLKGADVAARALGCGLNSLRREVPPISTGPSRTWRARVL